MVVKQSAKTIIGVVLDEQPAITLDELCEVSGLRVNVLTRFVEEGVLEPAGRARDDWRFAASSLARLHTALRLQHDLGVNEAGVALALELLEEVRALRARVRALDAMLAPEKFVEE